VDVERRAGHPPESSPRCWVLPHRVGEMAEGGG
jgi:hypothetical protein